jgi:hypothetical protein
LREQSRLDPILEDIFGYLCILRRHSFLRYISDRREYNVKRMVVIDGIVEAMGRATNMSLPVIHDEIPVETLREVSVMSVQRLMSQTIRNMKRARYSVDSGSSMARGYYQAILRWEQALKAFRVSAPTQRKTKMV